jgi:hypothetical protein
MNIYCVAYIEYEAGWGIQPDGYRIYKSKEECIEDTLKRAANCKGSSWSGPTSPLEYIEISINLFPQEIQDKLKTNDTLFIDKLPSFPQWQRIK